MAWEGVHCRICGGNNAVHQSHSRTEWDFYCPDCGYSQDETTKVVSGVGFVIKGTTRDVTRVLRNLVAQFGGEYKVIDFINKF